MIPGIVTKLTEKVQATTAILRSESDILRLTGAGTVDTINPGIPGHSQFLILIADSAVILSAAGNILVGLTMAVNRPVFMVYSKSLGKWLLNSGV